MASKKKSLAEKDVTNGGSALGEAIGNYLEVVLHEEIRKFLEGTEYHFMSSIGYNPNRKRRYKSVFLFDLAGTKYNLDGIIADSQNRPIVLLESKYIRYAKHNRDKGSWICNTHSQLKRAYPSIKGSISVLAGTWTESSLAMIRSFGFNYLVIPFKTIANIFAKYNIDLNWEENQPQKAMRAWALYSAALSEEDRQNIAIEMMEVIREGLLALLKSILIDKNQRRLKDFQIEVTSTTGEVILQRFGSVEELIEYYSLFDINKVFNEAKFRDVYFWPEDPDLDAYED